MTAEPLGGWSGLNLQYLIGKVDWLAVTNLEKMPFTGLRGSNDMVPPHESRVEIATREEYPVPDMQVAWATSESQQSYMEGVNLRGARRVRRSNSDTERNKSLIYQCSNIFSVRNRFSDIPS